MSKKKKKNQEDWLGPKQQMRTFAITLVRRLQDVDNAVKEAMQAGEPQAEIDRLQGIADGLLMAIQDAAVIFEIGIEARKINDGGHECTAFHMHAKQIEEDAARILIELTPTQTHAHKPQRFKA